MIPSIFKLSKLSFSQISDFVGNILSNNKENSIKQWSDKIFGSFT
jgi:hypothetical protein